MNKGLELIEAHYLFGVPYERITVVLDPKSTVHSMARFSDGAILAHLGVPDMRTPIGYALAYPGEAGAAAGAPAGPVRDVDRVRAPGHGDVPLPRPRRGGGDEGDAAEREADAAGAGPRTVAAPIVLNAANEVAVAAFLDGRLSFVGIAEVVEASLDRLGDQTVASLDDVYAATPRRGASPRRPWRGPLSGLHAPARCRPANLAPPTSVNVDVMTNGYRRTR